MLLFAFVLSSAFLKNSFFLIHRLSFPVLRRYFRTLCILPYSVTHLHCAAAAAFLSSSGPSRISAQPLNPANLVKSPRCGNISRKYLYYLFVGDSSTSRVEKQFRCVLASTRGGAELCEIRFFPVRFSL